MRLPLLCLVLLIAGCSPGSPATSESTSSSGPGRTVDATTDTTAGPGMSSAGSSTPTTSGTTQPLTSGGTGDATSNTTDETTTGTTSSTTAETTTGTTSSATADASSSTGDPVVTHCLGGEPLFQLPELTVEEGLEWCPEDGQIHRHTAVACLHPLVAEACDDPQKKCSQPCDALGDGVCNTKYVDYCGCDYPCTTDADCSADAACLCNGARLIEGGSFEVVRSTECVPANCHTDADCAPFLCAVSAGICDPNSVYGLFCRTAQDECVTHQECFDKQLGNLCIFEKAEQRWTCTEMAQCE